MSRRERWKNGEREKLEEREREREVDRDREQLCECILADSED